MEAARALRDARLKAGLTQTALAARAATSQATLSAYESGRKEPSVETLARLLAATGSRLMVGDGPDRLPVRLVLGLFDAKRALDLRDPVDDLSRGRGPLRARHLRQP